MEVDVIYNKDCLLSLARMEDDSVDLIVTSPPYNKGLYSKKSKTAAWVKTIDYVGYDDALPAEEYEEMQRKVLAECLRVLKPTGSLFYNHKDILHKGFIHHPVWVYDFPVHQLIVWNRFSSCMLDHHYFQPITEWVFWIVKDPKQFYFDKGEALFRTNIWPIAFEMRSAHPAPYPEKLVENIVLTCSKAGDLVYDPYMGSATTAVVAKKLGRHYVGSEISKVYIDMGKRRLAGVR